MNVMLIDDDPDCLQSLNAALRLNGFDVQGFDCPDRALLGYTPGAVDAVITDYHLPKMKGIDLMKKIHLTNRHVPVIIITGDRDSRIETLSNKAGARAFFRKPIDIRKIIDVLDETAGRDDGADKNP